ncbi:MAG: DJ-1/PfpI family protein [Nitrospirae bacterium]|nr:DJ-1/PfpI family protein [Nitrospirota bacterium]
MPTVLVPLAEGFEEIEAVTVIDILRRAGVEVVVAGLVEGPVIGRSGIRVAPDCALDEVSSRAFDMIVLPGGLPGTTHLKEDARIRQLVKEQAARGKYTAAICAAPTVLHAVGLTAGRTLTSHPSVQGTLTESRYLEERVVVDGALITSRAPGTALEFAFALVEILCGKAKAEEVNRGVLARL